jgi:hypothetical protein
MDKTQHPIIPLSLLACLDDEGIIDEHEYFLYIQNQYQALMMDNELNEINGESFNKLLHNKEIHLEQGSMYGKTNQRKQECF